MGMCMEAGMNRGVHARGSELECVGGGRGERRPGQQQAGRQDEGERESELRNTKNNINAERGVDDEQEAPIARAAVRVDDVLAMCTNTCGSASGCAGVQDLAAWCPSPSLYTTVAHPNLLPLATCFLPNRMSSHGRKRHADRHGTLHPPDDARRV